MLLGCQLEILSTVALACSAPLVTKFSPALRQVRPQPKVES